MKLAWDHMSRPPISRTCPFLIMQMGLFERSSTLRPRTCEGDAILNTRRSA